MTTQRKKMNFSDRRVRSRAVSADRQCCGTNSTKSSPEVNFRVTSDFCRSV